MFKAIFGELTHIYKTTSISTLKPFSHSQCMYVCVLSQIQLLFYYDPNRRSRPLHLRSLLFSFHFYNCGSNVYTHINITVCQIFLSFSHMNFIL